MSQLCETIMTPVYETCLESDPVARAAEIMRSKRAAFVAVTEVTHRVVGVLTFRELAKRSLKGGLRAATPIRNVLRRRPLVTVTPEDSIQTAWQKMQQTRSDRVLVTGRYGIVVGVITRTDISLHRSGARTSAAHDGQVRIGLAS